MTEEKKRAGVLEKAIVKTEADIVALEKRRDAALCTAAERVAKKYGPQLAALNIQADGLRELAAKRVAQAADLAAPAVTEEEVG